MESAKLLGFLDAQAKCYPKCDITHVYFNNLSLSDEDREKSWEKTLSDQLKPLEMRHKNVAVIHLPAEGEFISSSFFESNGNMVDIAIKYPLINSIMGNNNGFHISAAIKEKLYGKENTRENEQLKLTELWAKSLKALNLDKKLLLTPKEQQALCFHFIKFELTEFILDSLHPKTTNITCKDGIDRAMIASTYYHLIKSIESGHPLSEDEFLRGLHGAAIMVKGRGLNSHSQKLWQVINQYILAHGDLVEKGDIPKWLINWRNRNHPELSTKDILLVNLKEECKNSNMDQLVKLYHKVQQVDNKENPYRELAHQKGYVIRDYGNEYYGFTNSLYIALSHIKSCIIDRLKQEGWPNKKEKIEAINEILNAHNNPWNVGCFGQTRSVSKAKEVSEIFYKNVQLKLGEPVNDFNK